MSTVFNFSLTRKKSLEIFFLTIDSTVRAHLYYLHTYHCPMYYLESFHTLPLAHSHFTPLIPIPTRFAHFYLSPSIRSIANYFPQSLLFLDPQIDSSMWPSKTMCWPPHCCPIFFLRRGRRFSRRMLRRRQRRLKLKVRHLQLRIPPQRGRTIQVLWPLIRLANLRWRCLQSPRAKQKTNRRRRKSLLSSDSVQRDSWHWFLDRLRGGSSAAQAILILITQTQTAKAALLYQSRIIVITIHPIATTVTVIITITIKWKTVILGVVVPLVPSLVQLLLVLEMTRSASRNPNISKRLTRPQIKTRKRS